jgi:hypothetical protein
MVRYPFRLVMDSLPIDPQDEPHIVSSLSIDIRNVMLKIPSLDSIGIAGFGHDFHALEGKESPVIEVFNSFGSGDTSLLSHFVFLMGPVFPILQYLPTKQNRMFKRLRLTMGEIADELLARNRKEKEGKALTEEKSIIGLLSM